MCEPSVVSQSSPSTPFVLRAGSGLFAGSVAAVVPDVWDAVVACVSLTLPDSPSPETETSLAEFTSLPVTWIPTLLSNPQLLEPVEEHVAVTWFPLMTYESNPQPVADSILPENSATTVMLL